MIIHYHPTGEPLARPSTVETQGVSALLEGKAEVLIPEGNPRHARRAKASKNGNGRVNGTNGHAKGTNGHANGNGAAH